MTGAGEFAKWKLTVICQIGEVRFHFHVIWRCRWTCHGSGGQSPVRLRGADWPQVSKCGICGGQGNGTGVPLSASVSTCQYHSTIAPYSSIHLPPTLYNVFLPALQFSPVSIIPPLLHTHSFIYHPHCIMFFSHYLCFPLSVSFHHCSIPIHSSTTHTV